MVEVTDWMLKWQEVRSGVLGWSVTMSVAAGKVWPPAGKV